MEVNIYDAKTNLSKLIQALVDKQEDEIIIAKNGKALVSMKLINKNTSKRLGIAKKEMEGRSITLEELNSIDVSDLFYGDKLWSIC